ncbi:dihydrodipicolinate synthase family protein, partial [Streptomyces sp. E5N298]|uniref:dihydrodipicolinate synthase family protein n=1 Tax=Streptomyces sp. E5N298 TaxID=1851983 RepID=UPI00187D3297
MPIPTPLSGVVPPVITPLTPQGEVDTASVRRLTEHLITAGVHGLFLLGSSGEAAYLTDTQRLTALEAAVDAPAGRVPPPPRGGPPPPRPGGGGAPPPPPTPPGAPG